MNITVLVLSNEGDVSFYCLFDQGCTYVVGFTGCANLPVSALAVTRHAVRV